MIYDDWCYQTQLFYFPYISITYQWNAYLNISVWFYFKEIHMLVKDGESHSKRFLRLKFDDPTVEHSDICLVLLFYQKKRFMPKCHGTKVCDVLQTFQLKSGYPSWLEPGEILQFQKWSTGNRDWTLIMGGKKLWSIQTFNTSDRIPQIWLVQLFPRSHSFSTSRFSSIIYTS